MLSVKAPLQHVARVERQREGDAQVQPGDDQKQGQQPQRPAVSQPAGVLEPGVQGPGRRDRHDRQEGEVEGLVGQIADQLQPAVALGLGQLLGRHAGGRPSRRSRAAVRASVGRPCSGTAYAWQLSREKCLTQRRETQSPIGHREREKVGLPAGHQLTHHLLLLRCAIAPWRLCVKSSTPCLGCCW